MKKRILSALVALIISIPFVYYGKGAFYLYVLVLGMLGYREWLNLITKDVFLRFTGYFSFLMIIGWNLFKTSLVNILDVRVFCFSFLLFGLLCLIQHRKKIQMYQYFYVFGMTVVLSTVFSAMIVIRNMSLLYFLYLLLIPILNDTFAHAIGTMFGRHKLNEISPNKSWEGCIGGAIFGVLGGCLFYLILIYPTDKILLLIIMTFFLSVIGQLGDLFFSQIKRNYKIKDFGNIMPGHGGILDRFDNFIFVILAFVFLYPYL